MPLVCLGSGNICNVLSPGSMLLSANGSLAFKNCARYEDVASYKAPEVQQGNPASSRTAAEKVGKLWLKTENNKNIQHLACLQSVTIRIFFKSVHKKFNGCNTYITHIVSPSTSIIKIWGCSTMAKKFHRPPNCSCNVLKIIPVLKWSKLKVRTTQRNVAFRSKIKIDRIVLNVANL